MSPSGGTVSLTEEETTTSGCTGDGSDICPDKGAEGTLSPTAELGAVPLTVTGFDIGPSFATDLKLEPSLSDNFEI
jgi:hypothetical protein